MSQYVQFLQDGIKAQHGCESKHSHAAMVHEEMDGETVWKGEVEVFDLSGHPEATKAFAWAFRNDDGEIKGIAIINKPPTGSLREAVQAAIASGKFL